MGAWRGVFGASCFFWGGEWWGGVCIERDSGDGKGGEGMINSLGMGGCIVE